MNIPLEMISRCLEARRRYVNDEEAESVLADWAEETGFGGLAAALRADSSNVRWMVLADFTRMIDPSWLTKSHDMIEKAQQAAREAREARDAQLARLRREIPAADELTRDALVRQFHENAARRSEVFREVAKIISGGYVRPWSDEDTKEDTNE